jgi:mannan endo-1,6-alpha-mannosidase
VPAHSFDEGNDDQAFWGFALLSAAEQSFPAPPAIYPSWLQLAINLFANQIARWDNSSCGGGMKWQIYPANSYGYDYKNAISNGAAFAMAARLATLVPAENQTFYTNWATDIWKWSTEMGLVNTQASPWQIYDGLGDDRQNCTGPLQTTRWSYNVAVYLAGCAAMYNVTQEASWLNSAYRLLEAALPFTAWGIGVTNSSGGLVLTEAACESANTCDTDQFSFKGYLSQFMGKILNRWLVQDPAHSAAKAFIQEILMSSAEAAAESCSGGTDGKTCGSKWYISGWDGTSGAGQELAVLETIQSLLTLQ